MLQTTALAGWQLFWLVPYRAVYMLLYAIGWLKLLRPYDPQRRAHLGYLLWVTIVRESIDRLLPVASVGGGVAGVRLLSWRGIAISSASATVVVEILLTLIASYLFAVAGLLLLIRYGATGQEYRRVILGLLFSLPVPVIAGLVLRYGSVFARLEGFLRPMVGVSAASEAAASLDRELRACLRRGRALLIAGGLQLAAFVSGAFEVWFALTLFGHPVDVSTALILESMTQALRLAALVLFGHALGISAELALAVSLAKRVREVVCGVPALLSWQWMEGRRMRMRMPTPQ